MRLLLGARARVGLATLCLYVHGHTPPLLHLRSGSSAHPSCDGRGCVAAATTALQGFFSTLGRGADAGVGWGGPRITMATPLRRGLRPRQEVGAAEGRK